MDKKLFVSVLISFQLLTTTQANAGFSDLLETAKNYWQPKIEKALKVAADFWVPVIDEKFLPPIRKQYALLQDYYGDSVSSSVQLAYEFWTPKTKNALNTANQFWCKEKYPELCKRISQTPAPLKKAFDKYASWSLSRMEKIAKSGKVPESVKAQVEYYAEVFKKTTDQNLQKRAEKALNRIRPFAADQSMRDCYRVTVLDANEPNAFNTGCQIYVTSEILKFFEDSEEELISVLAHEMSHGDQGHAVKNVGYIFQSLGHHFFYLLAEETEWILTDNIGPHLSAVLQQGNLPVFLQFYGQFAPKVELQADVGAVLILAGAKINRIHLKKALITLHEVTGADLETTENYDSLRDYPSLKKRLEAIDRVVIK